MTDGFLTTPFLEQWKKDAQALADKQETLTEAILDRLRKEKVLAENGDHPILANSFRHAISEIERLRDELSVACGYMRNASIDLSTGCPKATAIRTIEGGLKRFESALRQPAR